MKRTIVFTLLSILISIYAFSQSGSVTGQVTDAIFSNISAFGPAVSATAPAELRPKHAEGSAMRIRRNSRLQVWNSVFAGWGRGLRLESDRGFEAAQYNSLAVQYTLIAGIRGDYFKTDVSAGLRAVRNWYMDAARMNDTLAENIELMIEDFCNYESRNFLPATGSPVLTGSSWYEPTGIREDRMRTSVQTANYPNPFSGTTYIDVVTDQATPVRVQVFDLTGKMVASLYEGNMQAGKTTITFNAEGLPKGIYIGKVITAREESMFKMIAR